MVLLTLSAGCGQPRAQNITSLQIYDGMRVQLAWATSQSDRVAGDVRTLDVRVRHGSIGGARQSSIRLKIDSLALAAGAGRIGNALRRLLQMRDPSPVATYLADQSESLSAGWYEGKTLSRLANLLWADPLGQMPSTSSRLARLQAKARHYALMAASAARRARAIRRSHPGMFRYAPVRQARAGG